MAEQTLDRQHAALLGFACLIRSFEVRDSFVLASLIVKLSQETLVRIKSQTCPAPWRRQSGTEAPADGLAIAPCEHVVAQLIVSDSIRSACRLSSLWLLLSAQR